MTGSPRRGDERTRRRTPCTITLDGRRHNGFVLDISRSGLFIQTSATPQIGQRLDIELVLSGATLPMHVVVARRRSVPPQLLTVAHGGIGVHVLSAPEQFYQLVSEVQRVECARPAPAESESAPKLPQFRVRVGQINGSRSRVVKVHCESEEQAGDVALAELGDGWKVLKVERVDP